MEFLYGVVFLQVGPCIVYLTHAHVGDATHSTANELTLFHWSPGGCNTHTEMHQQTQGKRKVLAGKHRCKQSWILILKNLLISLITLIYSVHMLVLKDSHSACRWATLNVNITFCLFTRKLRRASLRIWTRSTPLSCTCTHTHAQTAHTEVSLHEIKNEKTWWNHKSIKNLRGQLKTELIPVIQMYFLWK